MLAGTKSDLLSIQNLLSLEPYVPRHAAVEIRRATPSDIPTLTKVLASAFSADPFVDWLIPHDTKRTERMTRLFEICLTHLSNDLEECYTTSGLRGVALWKGPDKWRTPKFEELRLIPAYAQVTGWRSLPRMVNAFDYMREKHEQHMPEPHYYLFVVGVDPEHQRKGIGSRLLSPVLTKCDREGLPAYLETANIDDVRFYAKHGFAVCEHIATPHNGAPPAWFMRREPKP